MKTSIITNDRKCFFCGSERNLEKHHAIHGTANRKIADRWGLWVYLCSDCHRALHDKGTRDKELKATAEKVWLKYTGLAVRDFIDQFGKNFL